MPSPDILTFFGVMLILALLAEPLARRLRLPSPALLVLLGFGASELLVLVGGDTGIRSGVFHDLVLYVFVPVLLFASALAMDHSDLRRHLAPILFLAGPVMLLSTLITAALIYYGIGHPSGFPWIAALVTGALLSATDPLPVAGLLRNRRIALLLEGEGLFNDTAAVVLYGLLLGLARDGMASTGAGAAVLWLLWLLFGGLGTGLLVASVTAPLLRRAHTPYAAATATLAGAYGAYLAAELWLDASGVMAVLATGLVLGRILRESSAHRALVSGLWRWMEWLAAALMFLLMGVTVTLAMFEERWLAMVIGVGGVLAARAVGIYLGMPLVNRYPGVTPVTLAERTALFGGGVRGAVTLALALALPVELAYWWTIQSIAFGTVLFGLLVQTPLLGIYARRDPTGG